MVRKKKMRDESVWMIEHSWKIFEVIMILPRSARSTKEEKYKELFEGKQTALEQKHLSTAARICTSGVNRAAQEGCGAHVIFAGASSANRVSISHYFWQNQSDRNINFWTLPTHFLFLILFTWIEFSYIHFSMRNPSSFLFCSSISKIPNCPML